MKVCALVGASDFNAERFQAMDAEGLFDYVIAVDAGLEHLEAIGRKPDIAIGDFDSLGYIPKGIRAIRHPVHKDQSDMELALGRARSQHCDKAFVFGALGGRLDHTMANMQVFAKTTEALMPVCAIGDECAIFFVTGPDVFEADARESGTVSVISMSDASEGVFERGLEWELDDVVLTNRTSQGLSNELIGEPVLIGVEKGTIAIFFPL